MEAEDATKPADARPNVKLPAMPTSGSKRACPGCGRASDSITTSLPTLCDECLQVLRPAVPKGSKGAGARSPSARAARIRARMTLTRRPARASRCRLELGREEGPGERQGG